LRLLLRIPGGEGNPVGELSIETDLEGVLSGAGKRHVEHQDSTGLDIYHPGGRLAELHRALAAEELAPTLVDKADPDGMDPDLGTPAPHPEHQVGAGVHRREIGQPHVLEHAEHAELALLIDQGVIGNDGKIEMQVS
jgi:hypothetical protein